MGKTAVMFLTMMFLAALAPGALALCRTPPPGASLAEKPIMVWGQETLIAFGSGFRGYQGAKPGVEGPWLAPIITGVVLVILSAHLIITAPKGKPLPLLYWTLAFYPFATALVEFARVNFDASRYGFLTASWHNLPEYIILTHLFMSREKAEKAFPFCLLWVWFLDIFILFVPSLDGVHRGPFFGGLVEQLTGICCDHLLIIVFGYLWYTTPSDPLKNTYMLGFLSAGMHMLEIGPLVILLSGFTPRPYIPICILVAFTTPITFYLYNRFAKSWVSDSSALADAKEAIPAHHARILLGVGIALGLFNILGPVAIVKECAAVPPGPGAS